MNVGLMISGVAAIGLGISLTRGSARNRRAVNQGSGRGLLASFLIVIGIALIAAGVVTSRP
jgi:uncharacterized membrane protein YidH (DUF202 family)